MKKILLICFTAITILGCGVNKQAQQIKALEKCKYKVVSATNISVAGTDVKKIMNNQSFNIGSLPALICCACLFTPQPSIVMAVKHINSIFFILFFFNSLFFCGQNFG